MPRYAAWDARREGRRRQGHISLAEPFVPLHGPLNGLDGHPDKRGLSGGVYGWEGRRGHVMLAELFPCPPPPVADVGADAIRPLLESRVIHRGKRF
mgnify:CR=1 FL=1